MGNFVGKLRQSNFCLILLFLQRNISLKMWSRLLKHEVCFALLICHTIIMDTVSTFFTTAMQYFDS